MLTNEILLDGFTRVRDEVRPAVSGVTDEELALRLDPDANSIAWLVWHLTRVQDDHVAEVAGREQAWTAAGWAERFALDLGTDEIGYGHHSSEVAKVKATSQQLIGYHDAVYQDTAAYLKTLTDEDLDRVVDRRWDPPVTLGVRLVSVISDDLQHVGQAAFVRGLLLRRRTDG
jgi:uncharacterized damage-inducible protein DinB